MKNFLCGAATVATGILIAVAAIVGAWWVASPATKVQISLADYSCATDGKSVLCQRK